MKRPAHATCATSSDYRRYARANGGNGESRQTWQAARRVGLGVSSIQRPKPAYVVDVNVETRHGKPVAYRVTCFQVQPN